MQLQHQVHRSNADTKPPVDLNGVFFFIRMPLRTGRMDRRGANFLPWRVTDFERQWQSEKSNISNHSV